MNSATINVAEVLHDVAGGKDWTPIEVLFLTFNFDPGFFERGILARAERWARSSRSLLTPRSGGLTQWR